MYVYQSRTFASGKAPFISSSVRSRRLCGALPAATRLPIHSSWMRVVQRGAMTESTPNWTNNCVAERDKADWRQGRPAVEGFACQRPYVRSRSSVSAASASNALRAGASRARSARTSASRMRRCAPTRRNGSRPTSIRRLTSGREIPRMPAASSGVTSASSASTVTPSPEESCSRRSARAGKADGGSVIASSVPSSRTRRTSARAAARSAAAP